MTTLKGAGGSLPPYPLSHSGPVLVCGNAWCLSDDLGRARELYPDAPVIAVNGASANVKAFALVSLHPDKLPAWREVQEDRFNHRVSTHGIATEARAKKMLDAMSWVDHWWQSSAKGSSTWAARKIATYMGFSQVILCGMPMEVGPYQGNKIAKLFNRPEVVEHFRKMIVQDTDWHAGALSMSGWTAEILGSPT